MKKTIAVIIAAILALAVFAGCTPAAPAPTTNNSENSTTEAPKASFDTTKASR